MGPGREGTLAERVSEGWGQALARGGWGLLTAADMILAGAQAIGGHCWVCKENESSRQKESKEGGDPRCECRNAGRHCLLCGCQAGGRVGWLDCVYLLQHGNRLCCF